MNTNAAVRPSANPHAPRRSRRVAVFPLLAALAMSLLWSACFITEVLQPSEAQQGETIDVTMTVEIPFDDANAHAGVMSVLVPDDWAFVSGTYGGDVGSGPISGNMLEAEDWADSTEIVLPAPAGMKWVSALSDIAYSVSDSPVDVNATLQLRVGQALGTFKLGYFTTNDAFATRDIEFGPSESNTADTLMNQPITVQPAVAAEEGPAAGRFRLEPPVPNPFRREAVLGYTLATSAEVRLVVFDAAGRQVAVFDEGRRGPGRHELRLDARGLPAGRYLCRMEADGRPVGTRTLVRAE